MSAAPPVPSGAGSGPRTAVLVGVGIVALLVIAGGLAALLRSTDSPGPEATDTTATTSSTTAGGNDPPVTSAPATGPPTIVSAVPGPEPDTFVVTWSDADAEATHLLDVYERVGEVTRTQRVLLTSSPYTVSAGAELPVCFVLATFSGDTPPPGGPAVTDPTCANDGDPTTLVTSIPAAES